MKRALLISLSLVLALVGWSTVGAEDGFYVIPAMRGKYAPVAKTGQTTPTGTGTDGALQKGVAWPTPRFTDHDNGTVTDNLTRLIWTKAANRFGQLTWQGALNAASVLFDPSTEGVPRHRGSLMDGSKRGDWRLPNLRELQSLVDYDRYGPPLPAGNPFTEVQQAYYWTSTIDATSSISHKRAWLVHFYAGGLYAYELTESTWLGTAVWCVRGGP